jgi:hypothetical protein
MAIAMGVAVLEGAAITVFVLTGLFILFIGFNAAGIVTRGPPGAVSQPDLFEPPVERLLSPVVG